MPTTDPSMNKNDFDSPGFEYLRCYQNMSNLYYKLIALKYQTEFCSKYKCPPIHRFYFSTPSKNRSEQQFLFNCLCAWLIKDKCQMNLEFEPEEYEDPSHNSEIILEALNLLLNHEEEEEESSNGRRETRNTALDFATNRLKQAYGPEVVWTINILADRALELMFEQNSFTNINEESRIIFYNKTKSGATSRLKLQDRIIIGEVSLIDNTVAHSLDNYSLDDPDLLFDDGEDVEKQELQSCTVDPDIWYKTIEKSRQSIENIVTIESHPNTELEHLHSIIHTHQVVNDFREHSKPLLEYVINRVRKDLHSIKDLENHLQTSLMNQLAEFVNVKRNYSKELLRKTELSRELSYNSDQLSKRSAILNKINAQIESNSNRNDDESGLLELESVIEKLNSLNTH